MKTLYIDTHYIDVRIVLYENDTVLNKIDVIGKKNNSSFIMPAISKICDPKEISQVVVVNGPGSFTGVRLGVTIAKTIAYSLNIPIKVLSYFDVMFASNDYKDGIYATADNNGYFICEYANNISTNNYNYLYNKEYENFSNNKIIFLDINEDYLKIKNYINKIDSVNCHSVKPIYIKLIGVENDKKN